LAFRASSDGKHDFLRRETREEILGIIFNPNGIFFSGEGAINGKGELTYQGRLG